MESLRPEEDRRAPNSRALRPGALRCESCGTTWFDRLAQFYATACRCRRCGGRLHAERRAAPPIAVERAA